MGNNYSSEKCQQNSKYSSDLYTSSQILYQAGIFVLENPKEGFFNCEIKEEQFNGELHAIYGKVLFKRNLIETALFHLKKALELSFYEPEIYLIICIVDFKEAYNR